MKFLIDAQLPPALCMWLRERNHGATHVADLAMAGATDDAIAAHAPQSELILISKDEDFVTLRLPDRFALVWLRCGNASNSALLAWFDRRWGQIDALLSGGERLVEAR